MPYRSLSLFVAIFGSVFVVALLLLGRDLHRAARTGPGWKRKLVAGGLVVLGILGFTPGCEQRGESGNGLTYSREDFGDPIPAGQALEKTPHWKHLTAVWREAEEIGSGKRGDYPFDEKGKKRILDQLATVAANVDRLRNAGLLSAPEAGLLAKELTLLTTRVQAKRPTEMRMATCYEPTAFTPARDSLKRLSDRLPLLEKLADSETIQPQVVSKVLDTIEKDLAVLERQEMRDRLPDEAKSQAEDVSEAARADVQKIKSRLNHESGALETDGRWRAVVDAWKAATPLARSGKSTTAQRKAVDAKLESAKKAAVELAEAGLLSKPESELLISEAVHLRGQIHRNPPTDTQVECYDMAYLPPAQQSLERLTKRLPLLKQLAAAGTVHPIALQKVLDSIEADVRTLADQESLKSLQHQRQKQARELRTKAEATLAEIKKMLKESE